MTGRYRHRPCGRGGFDSRGSLYAPPAADPSRRAGDLLRYGDDHYAKLLAAIKAAGVPVLTDSQVQALAERITAQLGDTLADRVADQVIDRLAARLQPTAN
jgi:hypothetical protein